MGLVWVNQSLMYLCIPSKCNLLAALNCAGATCRLTVVRWCHHRCLRRFSPPDRPKSKGMEVHSSAKRWFPGCVNSAGRARQKW